jgi:copper homeostasis protein
MLRLLEICCTSLKDALAAERGGADRIELCEELWMGGITPDGMLIEEVLAAVSIPVFALIRSRGGDFEFDAEEVLDMVKSIEIARGLGVAGIVSGALTMDGEIDLVATRAMVEASRPLPFTFHRAFDACLDQARSLRRLREVGVDRILTSGGQELACDEPGRIRRLAEMAGDAPIILCCGGLRSANIAPVAKLDGVREFHSAARIGNGGVDGAEVRALKVAISGALL